MRTRITPNTDTFYAVAVLWKYWAQFMQNHCNWIKVYRQHESLVFGNLKSIWYDYCKGYHIIRFVGNKIKGWISKRVLQENKARQIFRKTNISYPLIRTRTYQGVRNVCFSENLACFVFLKHPFWDSPISLINNGLFTPWHSQ